MLNLSDLLTGESSSTIENYLDVIVNASNTEVRISSTGGFSSGIYNATVEDSRIILAGIDLITATGTTDETTLLQNLLSNSRLIID